MAYQLLPTVSHGETTDYVYFNKIKDSLDAINATIMSNNMYAQRQRSENNWYNHQCRWLFVGGDSVIVTSADGTLTQTFSDENVPQQIDLDNINWLAYGDLYYVADAGWSVEDTTP